MTREEAIQICKEVRHCLWIADEQKTTTIWDKGAVSEAMLMAIEALKRETHDGCDGCMYEHYEELTEPCASCKQNYMDRYIPMPKHDRDWIVGCIKHDGFIKTDRGDKANQIILEALKADRLTDGDLISRQAAIDALYDKGSSMTAWGEPLAMKWSDIQKYIEQLPSADRPRGEWISCEQRLPSENKAVLICDSHGNRFVGELILTDHGYKWSVPLCAVWVDIEDGDAWMPLPEPYKESDTK